MASLAATADDLALGLPQDEMAATPTLNLAQAQTAAPAPAGPDMSEIPLVSEPPGSEGLGLSRPLPPPQARELSFAEKVAEGLAVLQGRESPAAKEKRRQLNDSVKSIDLIAKSATLLQDSPPEQREKLVPMIRDALPEQLRAPFEEMAKNPEFVEGAALLFGDPRAYAVAKVTCSNTPGGYAQCMKHLTEDPTKRKMVFDQVDKAVLPNVQAKLQTIASLPEFQSRIAQMKREDKYPGLADLRKEQKKLPPELQLTDGELLTAERNPDVLIRHGIWPDKVVSSILESKEKATDKQEGFTFHQGYIKQGDNKIPVNVRTNKKGDAEAEIGGKWIPKPANVVIASATSGGVTVNMPGSTNVVQNPDTKEWGVFAVGKDGKAAFTPMMTEGGEPLKPVSAKGGPVDELIAEVLKKAADEARKKSGTAPKAKIEPTYYKGDAPPTGIARAKRDKDGRWYVERAGTKRYVLTVPEKK